MSGETKNVEISVQKMDFIDYRFNNYLAIK
jgi:hypothetical protein